MVVTWWRHQMETFSALLAICAGNSPVPDEFPSQRPVTRSFDVFFDLFLNKWLSKQSWGWWFETLSCPLWRHSNEVWGFGSVSQMNGIQGKFIESIQRLNSSTPNSMTYGETGTLLISYNMKSRMINFFMRLFNGKQSKLPCIICKILRNKFELGCNFDWIDSSPPSAAYMRQWIGPALVQIMAYPLFGAKPLSTPLLGYCQLNHQGQTSVKH